ncbi:MAG: clostripain-related cysteine peptidase, partial [Anaerolineales bacterium]
MGTNNSKFLIPSILAVIALCVACVCCAGVGLYFYGDQLVAGIRNPVTNNPPTEISATPLPDNTSGLPEWTVIVYSAADDEVLDETMWFDINEMELVGSNSQLNIVVQIDRYNGAFTGDGDWSDTRRYLITQDNDLNTIGSRVVQNLGEVDTSDPQTLVDFVTWAIQNYPAKKYALILSDHGGGWTGGFTDMSSSSTGMSLPEIGSALEQIRQNTGIDKFEMLGFDACLMGQIEVFGSLYPYSNYMIASEEVIPSYGWSYAAWLGQVAQNPSMDGGGLSDAVVSTYVVNDTALTELRTSANDIAQEESTTTLSAIESARVPDMIGAMNQFVSTMASLDQGDVAKARTYARNYYSVFGEEVSPSFIDLGNFSEVLTNLTGDSSLQQAAIQLQTAIASAVVAEKHGPGMSGSNGVSFHFPDSDLYYFTEYNSDFPPYYLESSQTFLEQSYWDEFLAFHYTGEEFAPQEGVASAPSRSAEIVAPGASELSIAPIEISDTEITGDEAVNVSTTVTGNVAYIHTALYFWDPTTESYWIGDVSYYVAENTVSVDGVNSPDYGSSPVHVQYEWSPTLYSLTDGEHNAFVLLEPAEYLSAEGETIYAVYGQYTDALSNAPVDARFYFDASGNFLYAYAFPDNDNNGAS